METFEQRLQGFIDQSPIGFIDTILLSIQNDFIPQLDIALKNNLDDLLILGIHSVIETISENISLKIGISGFKFYLGNFVDADKEGFRFSEIAGVLNGLRNIIAHQKISRLGHSFGYDYSIDVGYKKDNTIIYLNPLIFFEQFKSGFKDGSKTKRRIWDYTTLVSQREMEEAKRKFIQKFERR